MKWGNNLEYTEAATGCVFKEKVKFHKIHRKSPVPESLF